MSIRAFRRLPLSLLAICAMAMALSAQAQGQPDKAADRGSARPERTEPRNARSQPPSRARNQDTMGASIRRIRQSTQGQVLSAEPIHSGGRTIHQVKVMDDRGRVRVYEDDPQRHRRQQRSRRDDD